MRVPQQLLRDAFDQPVFDRPHVGAGGDAGAVAEPEDVGVNGHRVFAKGDVQHHVGGLAANARQSFQCRAVVRNLAIVFVEQLLGQRDDVARFALPQADGADVFRDAIDAQSHHGRGVGGVGEQFDGCLVHRHVGRLR
jgi:hypothetical protein